MIPRRSLSVLLSASLLWAQSPFAALAGGPGNVRASGEAAVPLSGAPAVGAGAMPTSPAPASPLSLPDLSLAPALPPQPGPSAQADTPAAAATLAAATLAALPSGSPESLKLAILLDRALTPSRSAPAETAEEGSPRAEAPQDAAGTPLSRAVAQVLAEVSVEDLRTMPLEQAGAYLQRIQDRMQGAESSDARPLEAPEAARGAAPLAQGLRPPADSLAREKAAEPRPPRSRASRLLDAGVWTTAAALLVASLSMQVFGRPVHSEPGPIYDWARSAPLLASWVTDALLRVVPVLGLTYFATRLVPKARRTPVVLLTAFLVVDFLAAPFLLLLAERQVSPAVAAVPLALAMTAAMAAGEEVASRAGAYAGVREGLRRLGVRAGLAIAAALAFSSAFFAALHVPFWGYHPETFIYHALMGSVFAVSYQRTGSLAPPVIAHTLFNLIVMAIAVSGGANFAFTALVLLGLWTAPRLLASALRGYFRLLTWPARLLRARRERALHELAASEPVFRADLDDRLKADDDPARRAEIDRLILSLRAAAEPALEPGDLIHGTSLDRVVDIHDDGFMKEGAGDDGYPPGVWAERVTAEKLRTSHLTAFEYARTQGNMDRSPPVLLRLRSVRGSRVRFEGPPDTMRLESGTVGVENLEIFLPAHRVWVPLETWAAAFHAPRE